MELVKFELSSTGIGRITLNDPDKLNAMSEAMASEFSLLVQRLAGESKLRVLIITGAGRAFSAGGDLKMLQQKTKLESEDNRQRMLSYYRSFLDIRLLQIPLIAAINGHAIGAGLCLASACDIRIAAENSKLGLTFTKLGLHPGMGATYFLPRIVGHSAAVELMITGRVINVEEALKIGLLSSVHTAEELTPRANKIAEEILSCGPEAVGGVLETLRLGSDSLNSSLSREAYAQSINYASREFREGVNATIEKRPPNF